MVATVGGSGISRWTKAGVVGIVDGPEAKSLASFVMFVSVDEDWAAFGVEGVGVDSDCCSEMVSPPSYRTPELGCSRWAGFGDTNKGEACGTMSSSLGNVDAKIFGCGEYSDDGDGVRGGITSLGK